MLWRRLVVAVLLVGGLTWFFLDSLELGNQLSPDAQIYVAMTQGDRDVNEPFRFRILIPFLASLMPFSAASSLKLITILSLAGSYFLTLVIASKAGVATRYATGALVASAMSAGHSYNYLNPFLTDGAGLFAISGALLVAIAGGVFLFALCVIVGVAVREATLPIALSWAHRNLREALAVSALAVVVVVAIRVVVGSAASQTYRQQPDVADAFIAWGPLWVAFPVGLWIMRKSDCRRLLWFGSVVLTVAAVASSFVASDTTRMVGILFPVAAVGTAAFAQSAASHSLVVAWGFLALVAVKGPVTIANRIFGPGSAALTASWVDLAVLGAASAFLILSMTLMRRGRPPVENRGRSSTTA